MNPFDKPSVHQTLLSLCLVLICTAANATTTTYLSSPMNGAMSVAPTSLAITAKRVTGTVFYTIDISTDLTFATIFQTSTDTSNTQVFNNLAYGTKYYARVSIDGGTTYGARTSFTTAQPILASPLNGAMSVAPISLLITPKNVPGASTYTIELSTTNTFTSIFQSHTGSSTQLFTNLGYGKKYYARVKTNLAGYGYGPVTYFTTASLIVTSPKNGSVGVRPDSVQIVTQTVSGASSYTIELSVSSTFSSISRSQTGSSSQVFTNLAYGKKYYARVKTDLSASIYGASTFFTTASPDVTSPARGAIGSAPKSIVVTSKTVPGASSYTIELSLYSNFDPVFQSHSGSNSQVFTDLGYGKRYYARVKTNLPIGDSLNSAYGLVSYFTTASPDVTSPTNGSTNVSPSVVITSKTVPGADSYTFEVSLSSMFTNVITATGSNSQPFNLEPSKKYYVRVKTNLVKNDSSSFGYGKTVYFTTGAPTQAQSTKPNVTAREAAAVNQNEEQPKIDHELSVYPNPTRDYFKVSVGSATNEDLQLNIYDMTGSQLHSSSQRTNTVVEVGHELKAGVYLLRVSTACGIKTIKVIKE